MAVNHCILMQQSLLAKDHLLAKGKKMPHSISSCLAVLATVKDLVDIEDTEIRREAMKTRMGLRGALVGRGGAGMRKGGDAAVELADLEFEAHASYVQFLEIELSAVQAQIDVQESSGVSKPNVEQPCHTSNR